MARATATWTNTDDTHFDSADLVRTDYLLAEMLQDIEHIAQTHQHRAGTANDGGRLRVNEAKDIWLLLGSAG